MKGKKEALTALGLLISAGLLCTPDAKKGSAMVVTPETPEPPHTPPATTLSLREDHARPTFSVPATPTMRCTDPDYLGGCISEPAISFVRENSPGGGTCSAWCVGGERVEVAGRGQMVNTKHFTIWTHGTLGDDCSTQEGNKVFWTGEKCQDPTPQPDISRRNNSSLPHVPRR